MSEVRERAAIDVSRLPSYAFGHTSVVRWGTLGIVAIEGTLFLLAIFAYLYLRGQAGEWPPGVPPPELLWGGVNTAIMLASLLPNQWTRRAAERHDLARVRIGMLVCLAFGLAFLAVRVLEFGALNVRWDGNAYGSVVWMLMGLHTAHLLTDVLDSAVLACLMFTGPLEGKRFVDVSENAVYWYFVVLAWLPIWALVYLGARFLQ